MSALRKRLNELLLLLEHEFQTTQDLRIITAYPDKFEELEEAFKRHGWHQDIASFTYDKIAETREGRRTLLRHGIPAPTTI